jgi:hypothetical protein
MMWGLSTGGKEILSAYLAKVPIPVVEPDAQWHVCESLLNNEIDGAIAVHVPCCERGERLLRDEDKLGSVLPGRANQNAEDSFTGRLAWA